MITPSSADRRRVAGTWPCSHCWGHVLCGVGRQACLPRLLCPCGGPSRGWGWWEARGGSRGRLQRPPPGRGVYALAPGGGGGGGQWVGLARSRCAHGRPPSNPRPEGPPPCARPRGRGGGTRGAGAADSAGAAGSASLAEHRRSPCPSLWPSPSPALPFPAAATAAEVAAAAASGPAAAPFFHCLRVGCGRTVEQRPTHPTPPPLPPPTTPPPRARSSFFLCGLCCPALGVVV